MARLKASEPIERRTCFAGANLTVRERAELERRAGVAGRRLSDFIRLTLLSDRPNMVLAPRLSPEVGRQIAVELARVGNNLNQLAHHANATHALPVVEKINATLDEVVRATEALTLL